MTDDSIARTSKASDEEPCELCEGTGEYEEQPCPSCVSRELNEELVKVRAEVERLRAIENAAMRVASSFVKRNNTVDPLTMHKLDFALKNQKPTGNETGERLPGSDVVFDAYCGQELHRRLLREMRLAFDRLANNPTALDDNSKIILFRNLRSISAHAQKASERRCIHGKTSNEACNSCWDMGGRIYEPAQSEGEPRG